jgi:hypothetical protein
VIGVVKMVHVDTGAQPPDMDGVIRAPNVLDNLIGRRGNPGDDRRRGGDAYPTIVQAE